MNNKINSLFIFCAIIFILPHSCFAWNAMGHRIIAQIAYDHLDPQAQQQVNNLIAFLGEEYPYNSTFQTAATWADDLREDDVEAFNNWHFYNQPFSPDNTPTTPPNSTNIIWALNQSETVLKSPKSNQFEKAFFLRFLLHLVGDAHQPLHCANRFTHEFPHGDEGGNLFPIQENQYNNLHAYWDDGLGLFDQSCTIYPYKSQQAKCLANQIETGYPPSYFKNKDQDLNIQDWTNESFILAKNNAYNTPENQPLSAAYIQQNQPIISQRIALAGYRLANLLNSLYG